MSVFFTADYCGGAAWLPISCSKMSASVRALGVQNEARRERDGHQQQYDEGTSLRCWWLHVISRMAAAGGDAKVAPAGAGKCSAEAKKTLEQVTQSFSVFRKNIPDNSEGRRLIDPSGLVRTSLISMTASSPWFRRWKVNDFITFYFVNKDFGIPRSEAFQAAIDALSAYFDKERAAFYEKADADFRRALIIMGSAILIGILLMILMRILLGRVVIKRLVEAGTYFDRIAGGDLTQRIDYKSRNEIGTLYEALRRMQESLTRHGQHGCARGVEEINLGSREIFMGQYRFKQPHRAASSFLAGNGCQHGRAGQHSAPEHGQRHAGR